MDNIRINYKAYYYMKLKSNIFIKHPEKFQVDFQGVLMSIIKK